ncbi:response regulator [uncultured Bacteroides sp.]|uniref:response regulator n=1 Tax=uncultured Bacteroides sp. TaxID=162156 RepID=UPI002606B6F0|nr:response regulator [uncultured Bacteroides sp.]
MTYNIKNSYYIWMFTICLLCILTSCGEERKYEKTPLEKETQAIDSILYANRSIDSLRILVNRFAQDGNTFGEIVAYNELGKCYREESLFSEAIETHKKGLMLSVSLCDTLQIIQALNNIGTNYRRIGFLDEASSYHYKALSYCEAYSDKNNKKLLKNRVISLNGIGNVFLTLENHQVADSVFRMALDGERILGSPLGQAINYANIGSIFESKGQMDSARHYYQLSMKFNKEAKSQLGISLCHTHFGRLYEKNGEYDKAIDEYRKAYDTMQYSSDSWHWIESCLSLARVYIQKGDCNTAVVYLDKAQKKAAEIHSLEHLAEIYNLEYKLHLQKGDSRKALDCLVKSREYHDSVHDEKKMTQVQNTHILYERKSKQNEISLWQESYKSERMYSKKVTVASIVVVVLACILLFAMWLIIKYRSQKNQMLQQMEQMRINFFTNITHEFRTPLTVIQSAAYDVLCRKPEDEDIKRDIKNILHHNSILLNLINQILDIAKMTSLASTAQPDIVRGDVVEFIHMICDSYTAYAADKGIRLVYKPQQEQVEMDFVPDYMLKIMQNLISNALKFSHSGSDVLVTTKVKDSSLYIYVSDSGIGMTAQQKSKVFIPFYQGANDVANIGTGIGLSLVKQAVEAMNGKIEVYSALGEGTTFVISLPVKTTDKVPMAFDKSKIVRPEIPIDENTSFPEDDDNDKENIRILIIEDTPAVSHYMMRQLNPDYSFFFASTGREGLEKAGNVVPDLIITDIMMPEMDGLELCRQIRKSELLNHIPVIMVTAKASHEDRLKGLEAGADAYLEKPFSADELKVRVEKLLEQRQLLRQKYSHVIETEDFESDNATPVLSERDKAFVAKLTDSLQSMMEKGKIDYDALAYDLCISRAQLNRKLKAITGFTTTEYILHIRISLAKRLLDTTDLPIWEVAEKCGMDNATYFGIIFKKTVGITPLQYKKRDKNIS